MCMKIFLGKRETRVIHIFRKSFPFLFVISTFVITSPMINEVKRTSQEEKKPFSFYIFHAPITLLKSIIYVGQFPSFVISAVCMSLGGRVFHFNQDFILVSV